MTTNTDLGQYMNDVITEYIDSGKTDLRKSVFKTLQKEELLTNSEFAYTCETRCVDFIQKIIERGKDIPNVEVEPLPKERDQTYWIIRNTNALLCLTSYKLVLYPIP